ncbi:choice-of-anchor I family protein [Waterburya agarophytonicola K14]|uniref:Choice-of-anchor I family protein n=1 Tax=Waterburya agarophytonicola KI4 TaxID=2874699 RepID=A0A964BPW2_9CYAN|nr:choice-of-anchor I family protein [Waterburya agarophytonicola]MCC0177099.1 choice-of-anchor I family protein [Waterburya agarophytonicola KI4]
MDNSIELTQIGRYDSGIFDEGAAEITAYDSGSQQLFVINGATSTIDILDLSDPTNPTFVNAIDISELGDGINSIAIKDGIVAAAIEGEAAEDLGSIVFFDIEGNVLNQVTVGALPDMVTFTPDGTKVLVANEGEPDGDEPTINPEGSVSIIDISGGIENATITTADFTAYNGKEEELRGQGVRVFPGIDFANDVEPEFITVSPDGTQAFVALQENNAIAVIDLETGEVSDIQGLGLKDYSLEGNGLDANDEDEEINIQNEPVFGLYQPDAIAAYEVDGETYYVTANEGDARDEDERIEDLELDPDAFPNAEELQSEENLGRLEVSTIDGDTDGDGDFDQLVSYGGRSFSIRDAHGNLVFDSGDDFAHITAEQVPELFNSNGTLDSFDSRSDAKGAEPEGVVVGEVDGTPYAFVGLERTGGIMVYDIGDPANSEFVQYINPIDEETGDALDLAPEGLQFIPADDSPNSEPLLTVSNEVSGTVSIYQIDLSTDGGENPSPTFEPIFGTTESETIEITGSNGLVFAGGGDDLIDLSTVEGGNRIYGGSGSDTIILGENDRIFADDGDDRIFALSGGGNSINGNLGADQFWIANAEIPDSPNRIKDFTSGEDVIGIAGLGIGFDDLDITQTDMGALISTDGNDLAIVTNTPDGFLSHPEHFVFA